MRRPRTLLAGLLVFATAVVAPQTADAERPTAAQPVAAAEGPSDRTIRWLGLGDSYSSGEGVMFSGESQIPDNSHDCARSEWAWAQLAAVWADRGDDASLTPVYAELAQSLPTVERPLKVDMDFVACSGAQTIEAGDSEDLDEQLAQAEGRYDVITFTFGGNDAGFSDILIDCMVPSPVERGEQIRRGCIEAESSMRAHITGTVAQRLDVAFRKIREQVLAPGGHVIVLGYPRLFDAPAIWRFRDSCLTLPAKDGAMLRRVADELNGVFAAAARHHHFEYADVAAFFEGHNVCGRTWTPGMTATARHEKLRADHNYIGALHDCRRYSWINGLSVGLEVGVRYMHSFHPNMCGHYVESFLVSSRVLTLESLGDRELVPNAIHLFHNGMAFELSDRETLEYHVGDDIQPVVDLLTTMYGKPQISTNLPCDIPGKVYTWPDHLGDELISVGSYHHDKEGLSFFRVSGDAGEIQTPDGVTVGSPAQDLRDKALSRRKPEIGGKEPGGYAFNRSSSLFGEPPEAGLVSDPQDGTITQISDGLPVDGCQVTRSIPRDFPLTHGMPNNSPTTSTNDKIDTEWGFDPCHRKSPPRYTADRSRTDFRSAQHLGGSYGEFRRLGVYDTVASARTLMWEFRAALDRCQTTRAANGGYFHWEIREQAGGDDGFLAVGSWDAPGRQRRAGEYVVVNRVRNAIYLDQESNVHATPREGQEDEISRRKRDTAKYMADQMRDHF